MKNFQCKNCHKTFIVSKADQDFYNQLNLPTPTYCPDCRCQRRMARRNERALYEDKCDLCGKDIITSFSEDKPYKVFCHECYWSDKWDAVNYGRDFSFFRPFFEQFYELQKAVPRVGALKVNVENCDYGNYMGDCKNCYLIFGSIFAEDCYYGSPYYSKSCVDSLLIRECELCYECITSENLYNSSYCQDCFDSHDLMFCYDCKGCSDCIGCAGLRNKKFHVFNQEFSPEEYQKEKERVNLCDPNKFERVLRHFNIIKNKFPRKYMIGVKNEKVSGNYINESNNSYYCFDVKKCDHVKFSAQVIDSKDCFDVNYTENTELCVDYMGSYRNYRNFYSFANYACHDVYYSDMCHNSNNIFGCINLKKQEYCILNKKYSESEYVKLKQKIIEHMTRTGEWGEYFPINTSLYAYNETVANEYFPLKEEEVLARGWRWKPKQAKNYLKQTYRIPPDIKNVKQDILQAILSCKDCGKNYKIIKPELAFYKQQNIPIPRCCPDCRHLRRMALRTSRGLWQRRCMCTQPVHTHNGQCQNIFSTAYSPSRKELVYCEECYNKEIY